MKSNMLYVVKHDIPIFPCTG